MSISRNTATGTLVNGITIGLGIVLSIVLTRSLGAEQRGVYAILIVTNTLGTVVSNLSFDLACGTLLAKKRYTPGETHTIALILALPLGIAGLVAASLLYIPLRSTVFLNVPYEYLLVALGLLPLTIWQTYWSAMLVGLNRIALLNGYNLVLAIWNTLAMIVVVGILGLGIPGFLGTWAVTTILAVIVSIIIAWRIEPPRWPLRKDALKEVTGFGLRLYGTGIAHHLYLRFDVFALSALAGTAAVGYYSLATSLAERLWVFPTIVNQASLSTIAGLPHEESALLTAKVVRGTLLIMLSLVIPFAIVSPWLVPALWGADFIRSVPPLIILLAGVLGFAAMMVLTNYIIGQMERPGLLSIISWLQLGVSIPLYLVLISWLGMVGAALASTITYLLAMLVALVVFARDSRLSPLQVLIPRSSDFSDYVRILQRAWRRLPLVNRQART